MPTQSIDIGNETYRISENLDSPRLETSLREVGQLSPLILMSDGGASFIPVCGFRRVRAMMKIGRMRVLACILPASSTPLDAFKMALWDNLAHRELNDLEKARALHTLKSACGVGHETLVEDYLPLLGLAAHKNVLISYLSLNALPPELRCPFAEGRMTLASAGRISTWRHEDQKEIAAVWEKARWSASLQRQLLDFIDELVVLEADCRRGILRRSGIRDTLNDANLSPFQRGERILALLHRWRNPRLSSAEERFLEGKNSLGLPGCVRLSPEPFFETPRLRVEFEAPSPQRFKELAEAVLRASESPRFGELFEVR